jgi:hypothetical protein
MVKIWSNEMVKDNSDDLFRGYGVEIEALDNEGFLKVKETLTRMGVASTKDRKLHQSCHILHKRGRYAILHFKELFALDGRENTFSDDDKARRNLIVNLMEEWGLVKTINPEQVQDPVAEISQVKVLAYKERENWELIPKYSIGKV